MSQGAEIKPALFVGSSKETEEIALAVVENLKDCCEATSWHDIFELSQVPVESLATATEEFDFAVLICAPDDKLNSRQQQHDVPRDNIIFEAGLFIGTLGRERVFLLKPTGAEIKLPSDLAGITAGNYDPKRRDGRWSAATAGACRKVREAIKKLGAKHLHGNAARHSAALCYRLGPSGVEFLLVKTTKGRWMLPKGNVLQNESPASAALRYAEDEGGILGRIEILAKQTFHYLKEMDGDEQRISCHLVNTHHQINVVEAFRTPTWFEFEEASAALTEGRRARYAGELRRILAWADPIIKDSTTSVIRQAGVLPYRVADDGEPEFLLVTSKTRGNWLIPKGHIEANETPPHAAVREGMEEAGVSGEIWETPLGSYTYRRLSSEYRVDLYALRVQQESLAWDEGRTRRRKWHSRDEAAAVVNERELSNIISGFNVTGHRKGK